MRYACCVAGRGAFRRGWGRRRRRRRSRGGAVHEDGDGPGLLACEPRLGSRTSEPMTPSPGNPREGPGKRKPNPPGRSSTAGGPRLDNPGNLLLRPFPPAAMPSSCVASAARHLPCLSQRGPKPARWPSTGVCRDTPCRVCTALPASPSSLSCRQISLRGGARQSQGVAP